MGMKTKIRDAAENSGEEIFARLAIAMEATLISKLFNHTGKLGNSSGGS